jgi:hypothetical protein
MLTRAEKRQIHRRLLHEDVRATSLPSGTMML